MQKSNKYLAVIRKIQIKKSNNCKNKRVIQIKNTIVGLFEDEICERLENNRETRPLSRHDILYFFSQKDHRVYVAVSKMEKKNKKKKRKKMSRFFIIVLGLLLFQSSHAGPLGCKLCYTACNAGYVTCMGSSGLVAGVSGIFNSILNNRGLTVGSRVTSGKHVIFWGGLLQALLLDQYYPLWTCSANPPCQNMTLGYPYPHRVLMRKK